MHLDKPIELSISVFEDKKHTLILLGIRCSSRTQQRDRQDIAQEGEAILGLGEDGNTFRLAQVGVLVTTDLELSTLLQLSLDGGSSRILTLAIYQEVFL